MYEACASETAAHKVTPIRSYQHVNNSCGKGTVYFVGSTKSRGQTDLKNLLRHFSVADTTHERHLSIGGRGKSEAEWPWHPSLNHPSSEKSRLPTPNLLQEMLIGQ